MCGSNCGAGQQSKDPSVVLLMCSDTLSISVFCGISNSAAQTHTCLENTSALQGVGFFFFFFSVSGHRLSRPPSPPLSHCSLTSTASASLFLFIWVEFILEIASSLSQCIHLFIYLFFSPRDERRNHWAVQTEILPEWSQLQQRWVKRLNLGGKLVCNNNNMKNSIKFK